MKRILLVNPHETEQLGYTNPPLGLLYIAGTLLKHGFGVQVIDGCLEGKEAVRKGLDDFRPDMVGVTCLTPGRKKTLEVVAMAKAIDPGVKVVLGGAHATIMHGQMLRNYPLVDFIVLGEGEQAMLELARGDRPETVTGIVYRDAAGNPVRTPAREYVEDLDEIPFPAWHLVDLKKYPPRNDGDARRVNDVDLERAPRISVIFSRGCTGHCTFCSTWWIWKGWRHRSARNMADELQLLHDEFGIRHFSFADDAMTIDREAAMALCDEIIARKMKIAIVGTTRTDCVDERLLSRMKEAGFYSMAFGIETASPTLLATMNKENNVEASIRAIDLTKKAGISTTALLIAGNVGETDETIRETIRFIRTARPDIVGCNGSLWILPGTKLYQDCKRAGFIDDDFWLGDEPYKIYTMEHDLAQLKAYHRKIFWHSASPAKMVVNKIRKIFHVY